MSRVLAVLLLAMSLLGTVSPFITVPGTDPWIAKPRYQILPWNLTSDYAFAYSVLPIAKAPVNPPGWSSYSQLPGFLSGPGTIVILQYMDSPIGKYDEFIYTAGMYSPHTCFLKQYQSVHRIWVSSEYSRRAGRNIWGFPKELATFVWNEVDGIVSVSVKDKDNKSGKWFFNATMSKVPLAGLNEYSVNVASKILPKCIPSLQWPIDDNTYNISNLMYATVPVYATAQSVVAKARAAQAVAVVMGANATVAAAKFAAAMQPLKTDICFDLEGGSIVQNKYPVVDPAMLTGRADDTLNVVPLGLKLKNGSVATLSKPELLSCW